MKKELSVVIPTYNETQRIRRTLEEVVAFLSRRGYAFEVIVVDDGSRDGTPGLVREVAKRFPQVRLFERAQNFGKGRTVKEGIGYARFDYCLFMDADNSTRITEWDAFEKAFEDGADAVIASRHLPQSRILRPQPFMRRFLGGGYRGVCRTLFGLKTSDFNCGFKAYRTALAKKVYAEVQMNDWTFDVEVFCLLKRERARVAEVPVRWEHEEKTDGIVPVRTALWLLGSVARLKTRF